MGGAGDGSWVIGAGAGGRTLVGVLEECDCVSIKREQREGA